MECQPWQGKQLDKDIIAIGNKVYCSAFCCFTTYRENNLLGDSGAARGQYPQGVSFNKRAGKFVAQCSANGKRKFLGYFDSVYRAEAAYLNFKYDVIIAVAMAATDSRIKTGLLAHAAFLVNKNEVRL